MYLSVSATEYSCGVLDGVGNCARFGFVIVALPKIQFVFLFTLCHWTNISRVSKDHSAVEKL